MIFVRLVLGLLLLPLWVTSSMADLDTDYAPIFINRTDPSVFILYGDITSRSSLNFQRAVAKYGTPSVLVLESDGGDVHSALSLAMDVHQNKIGTVVEEGCFSACFFVFAAGYSRTVNGQLGVHQIRTESGDLETGQIALSDIVDVLKDFDINDGAIVAMLRTPPDEMHIFSSEEVQTLGLERRSQPEARRQQVTPAPSPAPKPANPIAPRNERSPVELATADLERHFKIWSQPNLSALQDISGTYSKYVIFYGKPWSNRDVFVEKKQFAERWPVRRYSFSADAMRTFCRTETQCTVAGTVYWYAHSPGRRKTSSGTADMIYGLERRGNRFFIVSENGKVISRD